MSDTEVIKMRMAELQESLEKSLPNFPTLLRDIHIKLRDDPEQVAILSDEELGIIVKGLERHGNLTIVNSTTVKNRAKKTPISADDL